MKIIRSLGIVSLLCAALVCPARAENVAAVNEVVKLRNAGLGDDAIIAFIKSKNINYDLSADRTIQLRDQGVSPAVISAMLASGSGVPVTTVDVTPTAPVPAPAPTAAPPQSYDQPNFTPDDAYFHQELSPYGKWILLEDNQWYWQPSVVVTGHEWRPYWNKGHWVYTDHGWYWASDYPWSWATFHYGRWQLHPIHGWIWFPDHVWAPAWVVWRNGGDYCGWAPLPPHADYDFASGAFFFNGRHVEASFDFGLDWHHFNFTFVKEMGDQPRRHFVAEADVRRVYNQTTVINNYTVIKANVRAGEHMPVFNHGIDPKRVETARGHVVEEVKIQDLHAPAANHAHEHLDVQSKTLEVYRPKMSDTVRQTTTTTPTYGRPQPGRPGQSYPPGYNPNSGRDKDQDRRR